MNSAIIISSDKESHPLISAALGKFFRVDSFSGDRDIIEKVRHRHYDMAFLELEAMLSGLPEENPAASIQSFLSFFPFARVIVITSREKVRLAVQAVKAGADDYLTYPLIQEEIRLVIDSAQESILKQSELRYLRDKFWKSESQDIVQTRNAKMQAVFNKIQSAAPTKATILLTGETGTGKGVMAKLIHQHSSRYNAQFISVHCGAIPDTLLESELFGHEKGAFTGAFRKKLGKFEIARNGTIFLDEIGTITPSAQIKLLQVLQDGTFSRVGGDAPMETNARVVVATNVDLKEMTSNGLFRKDLFYRLNVFPIEIPALRERTEDIPFLVDTFLKRLNKEFPKQIREVHPLVIEAFKLYPWPGNIREMENLMERAYILETSNMLTPDSFPGELFGADMSTAKLPVDAALPLDKARRHAIEDFERQYLKSLLIKNKGRINHSAEEAGVSTRQLNKLMLRYGLRKEDFKKEDGTLS